MFILFKLPPGLKKKVAWFILRSVFDVLLWMNIDDVVVWLFVFRGGAVRSKRKEGRCFARVGTEVIFMWPNTTLFDIKMHSFTIRSF